MASIRCDSDNDHGLLVDPAAILSGPQYPTGVI
jgi:hypothetical protein